MHCKLHINYASEHVMESGLPTGIVKSRLAGFLEAPNIKNKTKSAILG